MSATGAMTAQLDLGLIRVHCFTCPFSVERATPDEAHAAMEVHYDAEHAAFIRSLGY